VGSGAAAAQGFHGSGMQVAVGGQDAAVVQQRAPGGEIQRLAVQVAELPAGFIQDQ